MNRKDDVTIRKIGDNIYEVTFRIDPDIAEEAKEIIKEQGFNSFEEVDDETLLQILQKQLEKYGIKLEVKKKGEDGYKLRIGGEV